MRLLKTFGISVFSLLILIAFVMLIFDKPLSFKASQKEKIATNVLESYAEHIQVARFNSEGILQSETSSKKLNQYQHNQQVVFTLPKTIIYSQNQRWYITSLKGTYYPKRSLLKLADEVKIDNLGRNVSMSTTKLDYYINRKQIETDQSIQISAKHVMLSATGMTIDLDKQTLELHEGIHTEYE